METHVTSRCCAVHTSTGFTPDAVVHSSAPHGAPVGGSGHASASEEGLWRRHLDSGGGAAGGGQGWQGKRQLAPLATERLAEKETGLVWQRAGRATRLMSTGFPRTPPSHAFARPPAPSRRTRRRRVPTAARAPGLARSRVRCNIRVCSDAHCRAGAAAFAPTTTLASVVGLEARGGVVVRHRGTQGECASARTQRMHIGVGVTV